jgi:hypothetical protein
MDGTFIFTPEERERARGELVAAAEADPRIIAAAHLGSAAVARLDRWSDIDIALCLSSEADFNQVLADWTNRLYCEHAAVANYDVRRSNILYRVFLLDNTLQIDLSFWRPDEFRAIGDKFSLIFGAARETLPAPLPDSSELIGMAWLYALHVRSCIARRRFLQAEYMLKGMWDNALALACKRYGVAAVQGRGFDDLPEELKNGAAVCLPCSIEAAELIRAFRVTMVFLLNEIRSADADLAHRLAGVLEKIVGSAVDAGGDRARIKLD